MCRPSGVRLSGLRLRSWFASWPRPYAEAVIDRLQAEIVKALKDPNVQARLATTRYLRHDVEEFGTFIKTEIDKTARSSELPARRSIDRRRFVTSSIMFEPKDGLA